MVFMHLPRGVACPRRLVHLPRGVARPACAHAPATRCRMTCVCSCPCPMVLHVPPERADDAWFPAPATRCCMSRGVLMHLPRGVAYHACVMHLHAVLHVPPGWETTLVFMHLPRGAASAAGDHDPPRGVACLAVCCCTCHVVLPAVRAPATWCCMPMVCACTCHVMLRALQCACACHVVLHAERACPSTCAPRPSERV